VFLNHLTQTPITSAQWHIPQVTVPGRQNMKFTRGGEWDLQPAQPYFTAKRAFLTDGSAISYAESVMGIVEHYKLAEIVGEPTAGTNGNVNPFSVPGGYTLIWTGMKVLKHDGSQHHGVGIKPTIPVSRTRAGVAAGRDEVLERALQLFDPAR
jgi:C-terminal processing protease CtpA/Prc